MAVLILVPNYLLSAVQQNVCYGRIGRCFKSAVDQRLTVPAFVEGLKKQGKRVPGIGHRIKSKDNRDKRVELLQKYARRVSNDDV